MADKEASKTISVLKWSILDFFCSSTWNLFSYMFCCHASSRQAVSVPRSLDLVTAPLWPPSQLKLPKVSILLQQCYWELEAVQGLPSPSSGLFHHFLFLLPLELFPFREGVTSQENGLNCEEAGDQLPFYLPTDVCVCKYTYKILFKKLHICKNMCGVHMYMHCSYCLIPAYKRL